MFEWFFGNSKKRLLVDKKKFELVLRGIVPIADSGKNIKKLRILEGSIGRLLRDSLRLYLEEKDILEKIKEVFKETFVSKRRQYQTSAIERELTSAESSLRKLLRIILSEIERAKREMSRFHFEVHSIVETLKGELTRHLQDIERSIESLCDQYDFLEYIYLSLNEIEFYTMKKRKLTKKTGNIEFFIHKDKYIIYKIGTKNPEKKNIVFITGSKHIKHHTNKHRPTDKHVGIIVSGRGGVRGSQFSKKFDDTKKSLEQVWRWEAEALGSDKIKWKRPILYFLYEFTESIGILRRKQREVRKIRVEVHLESGKLAILHGYPYQV